MHTPQLLLTIFLMVLAPSKLEAGYKMYLKIDGIIGESKDPGRAGWSDIIAFNHGVTQPHPTSTTRGGVSAVAMQDFAITKKVDKTSVLIWLKGAKGLNMPKVQFEIVSDEAVPKLLFKYEFENIVVRSVFNNYSPPPLNPPATYTDYGLTEEIKFSFAKIYWQAFSYDANGVQTRKIAYWDLLGNVGG